MSVARRTAVALAATAALLTGACSDAQSPAATPRPTSAAGSPTTPAPTTPAPTSPTATPTTSASPSPSTTAPAGADPVVSPIPADQWARIVKTGAWRRGCPIGRAQLRRVEVNHYDFAGKVQRGVLVVNADVADDIAAVFTELFDERFPIRKMRPVEEYDGDTAASLAADNTSAYNCRRPDQINAPVLESPHANGRAIDINPYENPWKDVRCRCWKPSAKYGTKRTGKGVITKGSLPWKLFTGRGWIWQNIDVPDYMHFDTGFPSKPWKGR